jgi:hypothetical protein
MTSVADPRPERPTIEITGAPGGWPHPWPNVAELARALPSETWTLIGGLMTQLHTIHRGIGITRPTNDVDIALHIETDRGLPGATARALEALGYEFRPPMAARGGHGHRWVRDTTSIDVVTSARSSDTVDVVTADHAAPKVREQMRGHPMVAIEGGTQALRRTVNARLEIEPGVATLISVPRPFGALVLKAAAHRTDTRDRDRHLYDAVALLACVDDPFAERDGFAGSDAARLRHLQSQLAPEHAAWLSLSEPARQSARDALAVLTRR